MKINKKIITPLCAIFAMSALGIGATYALFTSNAETNVLIQAGKVKVGMELNNLKLFSGTNVTGDPTVDQLSDVTANGKFNNGGTAAIDGSSIILSKMTPGDKVTFDVVTTNYSNVTSKIRSIISVAKDNGLLDGLVVKFNNEVWDGFTKFGNWQTFDGVSQSSVISTLNVSIELPTDRGNEYQGKEFKLDFITDAIQGNAQVVDPAADKFTIYTKSDLFGYAKYVNSHSTLETKYQNVILNNDIDLLNQTWTGIDASAKNIEFDGSSKTIYNLNIETGHDTGFFSRGQGAYIHHLNFENASVVGVGRAGVVVGHGRNVRVENVTVKNARIEAVVTKTVEGEWDDGDKAGAIVGYLSNEVALTSPVAALVKNCYAENIEVAGYRDIGGLVGYAGGSPTASLISDNTVKNIKVVNNRYNGYMTYSTDDEYHCNFIVGEENNVEMDNNTVSGTQEKVISESEGFAHNITLNRYEISSGAGLRTYSNKINSVSIPADSKVVLINDIDMSGINDYVGIGKTHRFNGVFDGLGHTISNLLYKVGDAYGGGIFADIAGGANVQIKNFKVDNVQILSNLYNDVGRIRGNIYGIVAGYAYGEVLFDNISISNSMVEAYGKVGAILGMAADPGNHTTTIKNCSIASSVTVKGVYNVCGLVGTLLNKGSFSNNTIDCTLDAAIPAVDTNWTGTETLTVAGVQGTYVVFKTGDVIDYQNVMKAKVCVNYYSDVKETQIDVQGNVDKN